VALEKRGGNIYYYRSIREGDKVRKVYVGAGELARIAHESDLLRRSGQEAERERHREELERLAAFAVPVEEVSEAAQIFARAHLIASGCHRHKGEYRRARDEARSA
jgi:hypothetical protein